MTLPDKTNPSRRKNQRPTVPRSAGNGNAPAARHTSEDVEAEDAPLHRTVPDRTLQHHTLLWVGVIWVATLACVCVVAIVSSSVPIPLLTAIVILAAAIPLIVRHVFPSGGKRG